MITVIITAVICVAIFTSVHSLWLRSLNTALLTPSGEYLKLPFYFNGKAHITYIKYSELEAMKSYTFFGVTGEETTPLPFNNGAIPYGITAADMGFEAVRTCRGKRQNTGPVLCHMDAKKVE